MAVIEKREAADGTTHYRVKVRLKGHPPQTATFPRLTDAKRWGQSVEAALRERRHFGQRASERRTVAEALDRYVADTVSRRSTPKQSHIGHWRAVLGAYYMADVTPAQLVQERDRLLRSGRSPATVVRYLALLSHVYTVAIKEWQWAERNPVKLISKPREPRGRLRFLSPDELRRLIDAIAVDQQLHLAVILSLATGGRQAEIMGLRWADVDLARGLARLDATKNGERRSLPITGPALALLREAEERRRPGVDLIFPGTDPTKPKVLRKPWIAALRRAEIADFRWHDLRHTAASYLAMNGATLIEIAEILGHKTLAMVRRYAHLSTDHLVGVSSRATERMMGGLAWDTDGTIPETTTQQSAQSVTPRSDKTWGHNSVG